MTTTRLAPRPSSQEPRYLGLSLFVMVAAFPAYLFDGFVFMKMWDWFVLRQWPQAPHIGLGIATGLAMIIAFASYQIPPADRKGTASTGADSMARLLVSLATAGMFLALAWFVTLFV